MPSPLDSRVKTREPCSQCRARGGDTTGDNLIVYGSGHKHCFACGRHEYPDSWGQMKQLFDHTEALVKADNDLDWPTDYVPLINAIHAKEPQAWIKKYGIYDSEIATNFIGWSANRLLLIFPVFDESNNLLMWQGRNFGEGPKYLTKGPASDILHLVGKPKSGVIVVTEDLLSAIKVGREYQAMPLWGSTLPLKTLWRLADRFDTLGIWLDPDKTKDAVKMALRASQYIPTFVVHSSFDPKEYPIETIVQLIDANIPEAIDKNNFTVPKICPVCHTSPPTSTINTCGLRDCPFTSDHKYNYPKSTSGS